MTSLKKIQSSIGVIGQGFVGGSLTTTFSERNTKVFCYDIAGKIAPGGTRFWQYPASIQQFVGMCEEQEGFTGIFFVCLPTPMRTDGSADLSIVNQALNDLSEIPQTAEFDRIAVVKSTVPPGSTERWNLRFREKCLHVIFNPEFLTEANALDDMRNQTRIVLGGPRPHINRVKHIFQQAFPKIPLIKTSSTTAEMVKYVTNCFLATKVSFANEIYQICEALDGMDGLNVDYDKVIEYAKYDTRLGSSHWAVPGPVPTHEGKHVMGYGSHCLPKDINALMCVARDLGVDPKVMDAVWKKNLEVRPPEDRDWEKMVGRAVSGPIENKEK